MDFIAIDFETANRARCSPCAIGLAEVRGGSIVSSIATIVKPPYGYDEVDPFNESIHGITQRQVDAAPDFHEIWAEIAPGLEGCTLVAHNASFDIGVLRDTLDTLGLPWPRLDFVCTMVLSRRALSLDSYRLPYVAEALGVTLRDHHDAGADAQAAAEVLLALRAHENAADLDALLDGLRVRKGLLAPIEWEGCKGKSAGGGQGGHDLVASEANPDADPDHPLFGKRVVFTGTLQRVHRQDAWERVAFVGGAPEKGVTKKTNVLVVGTQQPHLLRPGSTQSGKERRASELRAGGQAIEIMGEDDFLALVEDSAASGTRR